MTKNKILYIKIIFKTYFKILKIFYVFKQIFCPKKKESFLKIIL